MNLTPRERVEKALLFEDVDDVPSTVYECMIPQCEAERIMRNEGPCICRRGPGVYGSRSPGITTETHTYAENGRTRTPKGDLVEVVTVEMLTEAAPGNGFLIGIPEYMPPNRWIDGCMAINRAVQEHGRLPITGA